jgi:trehalose 6-phosphate synthase/phosphatase
MQRIVIVSNRLPFTVALEEGEWKFKESIGGLATGLSAYLHALSTDPNSNLEHIWVGWPGSTIPESAVAGVKKRALNDYRSLPVFLPEEAVEKFYQGFCNKTIWPIFHYFPSHARYQHEYWQQYETVNRAFADALKEILQPGDLVWIHDYHLMLLPKLVRAAVPGTSIGFFLHIPFPSYELFRLLPGMWRNEILEGLLGADLIGFHTYEYLQHFLRCVLRILGHENNMGQLMINGHTVRAGTYPMGIDFQKYYDAACDPATAAEREELRRLFSSSKVVLSVDRLDYSKGIINRLEGFEMMLDQNPDWRGKVTMILLVAPSRIGLEHYDQMKKHIEELVGKINGKFGTLEWVPIRYQYKAVSFTPLVALYSVSDVALITPLRDGMNLIAKEYIASRRDATGVLILSEMAGAVKELGEAIIINPNNREEIAAAIKEALEMPVEEQIRRNTVMQQRLRRYDVHRWARDIVTELRQDSRRDALVNAKRLSAGERKKLVEEYERRSRRMLLLDYDGTLTGFTRRPADARPSQDLLALLGALAADPRNSVALVSGRDRKILEQWFGTLPIHIAAEHGAWVRDRGSPWRMFKSMTAEWKQKLQPFLEVYADRLPGAFVEEKDFSLAWHYRAADPEQGVATARELVDDLVEFTANIDVQVLQGSKIVEVRTAGVNKGLAASAWISAGGSDFVLAAGDDWTDEDMFTALNETAYSIRVGLTLTRARYTVRGFHDILDLLKLLLPKP